MRSRTSCYAAICYALPQSMQILKWGSSDTYSVRAFDPETGDYAMIYQLSWFDGHVNAAAMLYDEASDAYYPFAAFDGVLCSFDRDHKVCPFRTHLYYVSRKAAGRRFALARSTCVTPQTAAFKANPPSADRTQSQPPRSLARSRRPVGRDVAPRT